MPRMRDIPERSRQRVAIIFPVRTLSGRPGRGFFAHLLRPRRRSRPRQEQQQDDQQRPRRARSSPITPHILPTVLHASHTRAHRLSTKWASRARTFGPHAVLHQDGASSKTLEFITRLGFLANCLPVGDDVIMFPANRIADSSVLGQSHRVATSFSGGWITLGRAEHTFAGTSASGRSVSERWRSPSSRASARGPPRSSRAPRGSLVGSARRFV